MITSLITAIAALSLSYVFADSALHKFSSPQYFRAALDNYRVVPKLLLRPLGHSLPLIEVALAIGLLIPSMRGVTLLGMAFLLSAYTAGMAINILRGRADIDCGCSGPMQAEGLSPWLLARNVIFLFMVAWVEFRSESLPSNVSTWFLALGGTVVLVLFYQSLHQLGANNKLQQKVHNHG
jgi:hypothetical protein|tara:strand:- start:3098 stop:3637 length:540 start_codon:yes stop_codon:yes gene_type:complete